MSALYPADQENVVTVGHDHYLVWDGDWGGFLWWHPGDGSHPRAWCFLRFQPDPKSTGHRLLTEPGDSAALTVEGSLLCPLGCGDHGFIRDGAWVPA